MFLHEFITLYILNIKMTFKNGIVTYAGEMCAHAQVSEMIDAGYRLTLASFRFPSLLPLTFTASFEEGG